MLKKIAKFSSWQMLAQVFSASSLFFLTAILTPPSLATFGLALSMGSLAAAFITLRVEQAIIVAESEEHANQLAWSSTICAITIFVAIVIAALLPIAAEFRLVLVTGACSALSLSLVNILQQVLIRKGDSSYAGRMASMRALAVAICVMGSAWMGDHSKPVSALLGLSIASLSVVWLCAMELMRHAPVAFQKKNLWETMRHYSDIWRSYLGQSILSGISLNAPYFFIFHMAAPEMTAAYLLADKTVRIPVTLVSNSIRSHLTLHFRGLILAEHAWEIRGALVRWSGGIAILGAIGLLLIGSLFVLMADQNHSDKWRLTGYAIFTLSIWATSVLSNPPATAALTAIRNNKFIFRAQAVELLFRLGLLFLIGSLLNKYFFIILFVIHIPGVVFNIDLLSSAVHKFQKQNA